MHQLRSARPFCLRFWLLVWVHRFTQSSDSHGKVRKLYDGQTDLTERRKPRSVRSVGWRSGPEFSASQIEPPICMRNYTRHEANQRLSSTTSLSIVNTHRPNMFYLSPSTSSLQFTTGSRIGQCEIRGESQRLRYASFSCYTY